MFNDKETIIKAAKKLDSISPSFCLAKWLSSTIHFHLGKTHSCHLPPHHQIPLKEIKKAPSALHNTKEKIKQRKLMMKGKRPSGCESCWNIEDLPGNELSDRHYMSHYYWSAPFFDKVVESSYKKHINPSYLEVSFSSSCNFKCSYCSPTYSSNWVKEIKKHGPFQFPNNSKYLDLDKLKSQGLLPLEEEDNPYIEAFWQWWPSLKEDLKVLRVTGGEPLLGKSFEKLFNEIRLSPLPNIELSVNSNLGVPEVTFQNFLTDVEDLLDNNKVRSFRLFTSVDSFGEQAEYIRNGLDFQTFQKRVQNYLSLSDKASLTFMCTFNILSPFGFKNLVKWIVDLKQQFPQKGKIYLDIPYLRYPEFMSIQLLPNELHHHMDELVRFMKSYEGAENGLSSGEVIKIERIYKWMKRQDISEAKLNLLRKTFKSFFIQHDQRRETDFLKTFPEMTNFWDSINL